ncbi:hypothetical protein K8M07_11475 [Schnuerera sp. xch1]|uniref:hypothetical protein n=1 Tax=Schnuerera sp. xch1 TaxID=2874283 RepID=UPI001CBD6BF3|nr:hypothetical protein [Schnuerera sp. xch1]MBZ2175856.1 hypothetical protein [Schnuerera sp. xch1]
MGKRIYLIILIIISIFLAACMNQANQNQNQVNQEEKAPETLNMVLEGIDELLVSVDSIMDIMELSESEFQAERSQKEGQQQQNEQQSDGEGRGADQGQNQSEEQGQSQGQNQNSESSEQQQKDTTRDDELFLKWKEVDQKLKEVHEGWNSYEVESIEKGANQEKGSEFKKNLNDFTVAIENRQMDDIVDAGSRAINSLAVFFELYKDEIRGDLSRIKYLVYQAFLQAEDENMKKANDLLNNTEEHISRVRQKLEDDDEKTKDLEKLSLAISDMKLALENNNIELLKIKRDVVIKNIKSLQE